MRRQQQQLQPWSACHTEEGTAHTRRKIRTGLLLAGTLFAVGAHLTISPAAWAKKGGNNGGGGDGHGTTPMCVTFADLPGDGVQSDGLGPYCDSKKEKVRVEINSDGDFFLEPNDGGTIGAGGSLFVQLDAPVTLVGSGITFQGTEDLDDLGVAHDERLVVVREANEIDIRDFQIGQSERRGVWVQLLIENPDGGTTLVAIHFYPNGNGAMDGITTPGTITCIDKDTWRVEIVGADVSPENPDTAYLTERYHPTPKKSYLYHHGSANIPSFTAALTTK